jgi:hypothetical protein
MAAKGTPVVIPTEHVSRIMDLLYGDTAPLQWVRELWKNAEEAGATKLRFGIDWQGVEGTSAYRRYVADNGCGMNADELVDFFSKFGESGKTVGTRHDNFGVGAKLTTIPWNPAGMVIVSRPRDDVNDANMIWIERGEKGYALRTWEAYDSDRDAVVATNVVQPYQDDDLGIDFGTIGPEWLRVDGGTVVLLFGASVDADTVLGDPERPEAARSAIARFLNTRLYSTNGMEISVEEFMSPYRDDWPRSLEDARASVRAGAKRRWQENRVVTGLDYFRERSVEDSAAKGVEELEDGSRIHWVLQSLQAVQSRAGGGGYQPPEAFVAFLYRGEIYDVSTHHATLTTFGLFAPSVYRRTILLIELPDNEEVSTTMNRASLVLKDGSSLRFDAWADYFATNMPDRLAEELRKTVVLAEDDESELDQRLAARFGKRLRSLLLQARTRGPKVTTPIMAGTRQRKRDRSGTSNASGRSGGSGGTTGARNTGRPGGSDPAEEKRNSVVDLPRVEVSNDENPDVPAMWDGRTGYLYLNHPAIADQLSYWVGEYPPSAAEQVRAEVVKWYRTQVKMKIAHSEHLRRYMTDDEIEQLQTPYALTMGLLGLVQDDYYLGPNIRLKRVA